jgi:alpha-L-rhamnosidase
VRPKTPRDHTWKPVQTLGAIENSVDMFQWNGNAGLYDWPGYDGISQFLKQYALKAEKIEKVFEGRSHFENLQALTGPLEASSDAVRVRREGLRDAPA